MRFARGPISVSLLGVAFLAGWACTPSNQAQTAQNNTVPSQQPYPQQPYPQQPYPQQPYPQQPYPQQPYPQPQPYPTQQPFPTTTQPQPQPFPTTQPQPFPTTQPQPQPTTTAPTPTGFPMPSGLPQWPFPQPTGSTGPTGPAPTGGAPATPIDPNFATAATLPLGVFASTEAPGMQREGGIAAANFQEGQVLEQPVTIAPGRCYTILAVGIGIQEVDIQLVPNVNIPNLPGQLARDTGAGHQASLGGKGNCYRSPIPAISIPAKYIVRAARGSGLAAAAVYVK